MPPALRLALLLVKTIIAACDGDARCQSLYIPFERTGECFIKIVQVKDRLAVRTIEPSEIAQMGITAQFNLNIGARAGGADRSLERAAPRRYVNGL